LTPEFVRELQEAVNGDPKWLATTKGLRLTAKFRVDDKYQLTSVEDGKMSEPRESSLAEKADASFLT
jgi:hypothetical protein